MNTRLDSGYCRNSRTIVACIISALLVLGPLAPMSLAASWKQSQLRFKSSSPSDTKVARSNMHLTTMGPAALPPNITATKVDSFPDPNLDGKADPGETITYDITITNSGADATGVVFTDTIDPHTTLVPLSVHTQPIANNDSYSVLGNVRIQPAAGAGLLVNDLNPDTGTNAGLTASGPATTAQGGNITINGDGSFSYNPPAGFEGTDTVIYTVTGSGGKTDTATVTFTVSGMIWFVNAAASPGGDGRLTSPYNCFSGAGCYFPAAADDPGDSIFLFSGSYIGGVTLLNNQKVIGQASSLSLTAATGLTLPPNSDPLPPTGGPSPIIMTTAPSSNALNLGSDNELRGFTIGDTTDSDIAGNGFGTLTINELVLNGAGRALNLNNGTLSAILAGITVTASPSQGVSLTSVAGSLLVPGGTNVSGHPTQCVLISGSTLTANFGNTTCAGGSDGISLQNNSSGTRNFGTLNVSGGSGNAFLHAVGGGNVNVGNATLSSGNTVIEIMNASPGTAIIFGATAVSKSTPGGAGVDWSGTNTGASLTFTSLDVGTTNASGQTIGLNATGSGSITVAGPVNSQINAGRGPAIVVANNVLLNTSFTSVSSDLSTSNGVNLNNVTGNSNFGGGTITNATGASLLISGGNIALSYGVSITQNNPVRAVDIQNTIGGSINLASGGGNVTCGSASTGILLTNNVANVTFNALNLGTNVSRMTNQAVTITGGSGTKTLGTVNIFTTGATGISSSSSTGAISSASGTVDSVSAPAVNIVGVSPANRTPLNIQLTNLSANGSNIAANGLVLTNTSSTGAPGGFRVLGTGAVDGSGGTIQNTTTRGANINTAANVVLQNMNFTNANSTVDGGAAGVCDDLTITGCNAAIYLNTVTTATLDNLNITGTMVENGITAVSVVDFKLDNSLLDGCGDSPNESCVEANNLSGTSTVNNTEIRFSETNCFDLVNTDQNLNLTINGSIFRDTQTQFSGGPINPNGEGGFQFRSFSVAGGSPITTININNSQFLRLRTQGIQAISQDDSIVNIDITGNTIDSQSDIGTGIDLNSNNTGQMNFNILNNPVIHSRGGSAVNITSFLNGHTEGRVNDNPDIMTNGTGAGGIGIRFVAQDTSRVIAEARRNTVTESATNNDNTIDAQARFQTARVDVTLDDNTTTVNNATIADINLTSGSSTAGESNALCANLVSNNASGTGAARALRVRVSDLSNLNRVFLEGFTVDTATTWIAKGNTPALASEVVVSLTGTAVAPLAPPGGVCTAVTTSADFVATPEQAVTYRSVESSSTDSSTSRKLEAVSTLSPSAGMSGRTVATSSGLKNAKVNSGIVANYSVANNWIKSQPINQSPQKRQRGRIIVPRPVPNSGESVMVNIGTLAAGESVTITFQVTVDVPYLGGPFVSNQGMVSGSNFASVLTDDPAVGGASDPTLTPIASVPNVSVNDAQANEPASGSTPMLFTVALSTPAGPGGITVHYSTADQAPGPGHATAGVDYTAIADTVLTFASGEQVKTISVDVLADAVAGEPDETFLVNLSSPTGANIIDGQAVGTIKQGNAAGTFLITELRTTGPAGAGDDFVELYNNTDAPLTITASDATAGYGLFKIGNDCSSNPVLIATIPNGTVIPARAHYLLVGSAYSLGAVATGDQTLTADIEIDRNVGIFSTTNAANVSSTTRLDAVGFGTNTGGICDLLREGTTIPALVATGTEHSFTRDLCGKGGSVTTFGPCPSGGRPVDTNDNNTDFLFEDTQATATPAGQRLGAPGPENSTSTIDRNSTIATTLVDPGAPSSSPPNRVRDLTPDPANNSTFGTLSIRRTFTNNTGAPITRLRFRVVDVSAFPVPGGIADVRARTSGDVVITLTGGGTKLVHGTTLETPPTQPNGGAFNATMAAGTITLGTPLAAGASVDLQFLLGVQSTGTFKFFVNIEALP